MPYYLKYILLSTFIFLYGCVGANNSNYPSGASKKTMGTIETPTQHAIRDFDTTVNKASINQTLSKCLFEASQLTKINSKKYHQPVNALYQNILAAKYYASVASKISDSNTDTLTPMYQFRVNDDCNAISQLLLNAFKQGEHVTESESK